MKRIVLVFFIMMSLMFNVSCAAGKGAGGAGGVEKKVEGQKKEENVTIICDEMVMPLVYDLAHDFNLNKKSKVSFKVLRKNEAFSEMKKGKNIILIGYLSSVDKEDESIESKEIAEDGIVVVVSKENPMDSISLTQLRDTYTGKITKWNELVGDEKKELYTGKIIIPITYNNYDLALLDVFEHDVINTPVKGYYGDNVVYVSTVGESKGRSKGKYNLGYVNSMNTDDDLKILKLNGIRLTLDSLSSNLYPLKVPIKMYYKKEDKEGLKEFIKYVTNDDGKKIVRKHCLDAS